MHERASHTPGEGGRTHLERAAAPPLAVRGGGPCQPMPRPAPHLMGEGARQPPVRGEIFSVLTAQLRIKNELIVR